ncbi:MAG TPA: hypothetical protein VG894_00890 [Bauldia sp.]|jgi:hypothetical protein|nr:hypothetical protein [Bauldia sp.]
MRPWFHTAIIAATVVATVAVGVASAALTLGANASAPKGDRLPVVASTSGQYVTVEQRGDGVSTLEQIRLD